MKILLLGKSGQVGWELQRSLAPLGQVIALDRHGLPAADGLPPYCGDLNHPAGLAATVRQLAPDVIVNAAAHTAVDQAESDTARAFCVNADAPAALAEAAAACGAWLLHYSTDYVFNGSGEKPWQEDDATGPLNVYGQSKLAGEQAIVARCPRHLILRTSWVYAARGSNFARTMLDLARQRPQLNVVGDQFGAPTGAELIADVSAHLLRQVMAAPACTDHAGIYHLAAEGETCWCDYARHVIACASLAGMNLQATPDRITPVPTEAWPRPARRPHNSRLDTRKLQRHFGLTLPPWQQGVERMLDEILPFLRT